MAGKYLKELPSFDKENFSKFKADDHSTSTIVKPVTYIQTKDTEDVPPQIITTDKTNILLRYLRQQLHEKDNLKKREPTCSETESNSVKASKVPRLDIENE